MDSIAEYSIYDIDGTEKCKVVAEENSVYHVELMKSDYVKLCFKLYDKVAFGLGDYIYLESDGGKQKFEITEIQKPTYDTDTGSYSYELQFNAEYYKWGNKIYKYEPKNDRFEATWTLTDTLVNHLNVLIRNLAYYGWEFTYNINDVANSTKSIYIQFDNISILDALTKIAEAFDTEWIVTDNIITLGRVELGSDIELEQGVNVEKISASNSSQSYVTTLYAFGSTNNLPSNYRKSDSQVLLNGVVQKRLMLPKGTPYVQLAGVSHTEESVEGIVTFDDVYPKMDNKVTEIKAVEKIINTTDTIEADAGTTTETTDKTSTTTKVNIYRIKDSSLSFKKEYILEGVTLQAVFSTGKLAGMVFDLAFNPDGESETVETTAEDGTKTTSVNADSQWFELVRNNTYGVDLPNDTLKPAEGDKFVLIGWDATKMDKIGLIEDAEKELLERTKEYAKKLQIDPSTYTCTMMSDYMYGLNDGQQDENYSMVGKFSIGQRVLLKSEAFLETGSRESRVIGFEYKLDFPYDSFQVIIGENTAYSYRKDLEASVSTKFDSINFRGGTYNNNGSGNGGSNLYVITTTDVTTPTDRNVLSALRTERDFIHSAKNDNISALHTFESVTGSRRGLQTSHYRNALNEDNLFGHGFELVMRPNKNGAMQSRLEVDELLVRVAAYFASLEIRRIAYVGGNYIFTPAGGKIYHVEWVDEAGEVLEQTATNEQYIAKFRCYLYSDDGSTATMNGFKDYDQVLCRTFNIDEGVHENVHNQYYWRLCSAIGKKAIEGSDDTTEYQYIELSNVTGEYLDTLSASGKAICYPKEGDTIVTFGNWKYEERQGVIYFMVEGDLSPAIIQYKDVGANDKHFQLPEMPDIQISPRGGNIFHGRFISVNDVDEYKGMSIDEIFASLLDKINEIEQQADKKFEMWFIDGKPHPLRGEDYSKANPPASDWTTNAERNLHLQDLYYDTEKDPASDGGRAWRWQSATANNTTSWYWEEVTDKDTIEALEKARDLQNQVDDISSDSVLSTGSEKTRILIEWYSAIANYKKYWEQADDYGLTKDEHTSCHSLHDAFFALATMLNDGTTYSETDCAHETVPSWIDKDFTVDTYLSGYVTNSNTQGVEKSTYSKEQYKDNWKEFYKQLAAVLKDIKDAAAAATKKAQDTADDAVKSIDEICNDNILDPSEKQTLKRDFRSLFHEIYDDNGLEDKGKNDKGNWYNSDVQSAFNDLVTAFKAVGTYLNGGTEWNIPATDADSTLPSWIKDANMGAYQRDIDGDKFVSLWTAMYSKRGIYLTILSKTAKDAADAAQDAADKAQDTADKKVQTFVSRTVPETPYDSGDMWVNTVDNNNLLISMQSRLTETGTTYPNDWFDLSTIYDKYDPRMILSAMADKVYEISGGSLESRGSIKVFLNPSNLTNGNEGDIALNNDSVYRYSTTWNKLYNSSYETAFKSVYNALGSVIITVYSAIPSTNAIEHDLVLRTISWHDPFNDEEDVKGNVEVLMYNGKSWETLKECTRAIIDNLGKEIRAVVFGSNGTGEIDASGLITKTMFNDLFSEHVSSDGLVTRASVETVIEFDDDGKATGIVNIDADKINFKGKTVINDKFTVDDDGNVTMDGFTATNAKITGTINATQGYIAGFKISGSYIGLNQDFGNGTSGMWLSDTEIGFNDYSGERQAIFGTWNNLGSDQLCRMYDTKNSLMPKLGMSINVKNSVYENTAIALLGGNISGFAMKTLSLGLDSYTNSTTEFNNLKLGEAQKYTLERGVNAVIVHTLFYWREKSTDDYQNKNHDMYITLPDVTDADDGHVIFIKRGKNGSKSPGEIRVYPGKYTQLVSHSSGTYNISYTKEDNMTFINYNTGDFITGVLSNGSIVADYFKLESDGDAMAFIFFKSLSVTQTFNKTKKTFKGCWVQWKNPRDW